MTAAVQKVILQFCNYFYIACRLPRLPVVGKHFFEPISRLLHGTAAGKIKVALTPRFTRDYTVPYICYVWSKKEFKLFNREYLPDDDVNLFQCQNDYN